MRTFLLLCLMLPGMTACLSPSGSLSPAEEGLSGEHPWAGALRALDPADTASPSHDITAVYLRRAGEVLQIRVDLLAFQSPNDLSVNVEIGDESTPGTPPLTVRIPSEEDQARFHLDPLLATLIVEFPLAETPSRPYVDVSTPEDEISGLRLDGPVPTQTAPLLLTFHDVFAARFPAEALRSWDGAHTGPRGERHGLVHLLDAVAETRTPIVLLDLKKPDTLSALDAIGVLPQIQHLEQDGLLILPDRPGQEPLFGFSHSQFTGGETIICPIGVSCPAFARMNDPDHIYHPLFSKNIMIPIGVKTDTTQPTPDGASLEVRRALLETALNEDEKDLLVLGGSLRNSTWGSPEMVRSTLAYFASRPYINILTADELMNFPVKVGRPEQRPSPPEDSLYELESRYKNLTEPVLEFVTHWEGSPLSSCATDIDKDGKVECVLANEGHLAILDPEGARLTYLFAVERVGRETSPKGADSRYLHQLIGPSWQVASGLSSSSLWDMSAGEAADPGAYPGAFADADGPFKPYHPNITGDTVVFTSADGARVKTFQLNENGLEVKYQTGETIVTQIPLLVDPNTRFQPGWAEKYVQEKTPGGLAWGLQNGLMVRIQFDGPVEMRAFNDSLSLLAVPEDPDFDYPPGHYTPFPMAIIDIKIDGAIYTIHIK